MGRPTPRPSSSSSSSSSLPTLAAWTTLTVSTLLLLLTATPCEAAQDFTSNLTNWEGTWSTGTGAVVTGPGFADPMNNNKPFKYPTNTGISYSFTNDGYFEESQYRFLGNGSKPTCSKAVAIWQHGRYYFHDNGSVTMDPSIFSADGRVLVQDPCAAQTEILTYYNQPELFNGWTITIDNHHQAYMLQLIRFDGSYFPRLFLTVRPPTMLPTADLTAAT
ncbi:BQ5605_C009g05478 [Microbotryum silenes-dioicae]|uniref:Protein ROT1 n=1 Tax=Microbotryum silenes-dioicae TaxID=796604 RepID=A0A2X0N727_9BASI|nr:BQ5605_C009g05478 [Microbotryum silenes-dioicae]